MTSEMKVAKIASPIEGEPVICERGIRNHNLTGPVWVCGLGSPEGVLVAPIGSMYSRTDGAANTSFYVKETGTGNTGWSPK